MLFNTISLIITVVILVLVSLQLIDFYANKDTLKKYVDRYKKWRFYHVPTALVSNLANEDVFDPNSDVLNAEDAWRPVDLSQLSLSITKTWILARKDRIVIGPTGVMTFESYQEALDFLFSNRVLPTSSIPEFYQKLLDRYDW